MKKKNFIVIVLLVLVTIVVFKMFQKPKDNKQYADLSTVGITMNNS
tara:strand:- start:1218 stop:1355 length:138 start_codon:yes stop_codon:yes gene_type:complete